MLSLIQRLIVVILLVIFVISCVSVNTSTCIKGDGKSSSNWYYLGDREIKQGEDIDYFVTLDCWGIYSFSMGIAPRPRYIYGQGVVQGERNNYYEEVLGEDGTVNRKLLGPYLIRSEIEIRSMDNPEKRRITQKEWELPPVQSGLDIPKIIVPRDFATDERLRIRISIFAEGGFYEDYGFVSGGIIRNMVID